MRGEITFFVNATRKSYYIYLKLSGMETSTLVKTIGDKIRKLKERSQRLEKENSELQQTVFGYLAKIDSLQKELEILKKQSNTRILSETLTGDKKKMQKELDQYIHLIDKCIAAIKVGKEA